MTTDAERRRRIHEMDPTVRVGKGGIESVAEEVDRQLGNRDLVKVKFLRASRGGTTTEDLATTLADRVGATVVQTRGHTTVLER